MSEVYDKVDVNLRPCFYILGRDGNKYSVDQLTVCMKDGKWGVQCISSGDSMFFHRNEIIEIEFDPQGANYCQMCDKPITIVEQE